MAFDCYLKIPTIDGEATTKSYEKWIELVSFQHGVAQHSGGSMSAAGGLSGGRVEHQNFTIVHALDKSSPKLALSCCMGEHIADITVDLLRATGDAKGARFMQYKMSQVVVSAVRPAGSSKGVDALPLEEVSFSYGKIEWTYTEYDHAGKKKGDVKTAWSVTENSKV